MISVITDCVLCKDKNFILVPKIYYQNSFIQKYKVSFDDYRAIMSIVTPLKPHTDIFSIFINNFFFTSKIETL